MAGIAREYLQTYAGRPAVVLNMMFHNVEVLPGLSPYSATEEDCSRYLADLRSFFDFCRSQNIQGIGISHLYEIFKK